MPSSPAALRRLFRRKPVVDLGALCRTLKTDSRMTVFRRLKELGYLSSYTDAGRYYTLADLPRFDEHGLWFFQGIGFSRAGTLKNTVVKVVEEAEAGQTPTELEELLRVRVRNTLVVLVREAKIAREPVERFYLYVSAQSKKAARQISARRELLAERREALAPLSPITVVEILVEVVQCGRTRVAPAEVVAKRLTARGITVTSQQVQGVFARYGLEPKKKGD
jgi:hypothetical protein